MSIEIPEDNPTTPAEMRVDLLANFSDGQIAFEHTQVGPYKGCERDNEISKRAEESILEHMTGVLVDETIELHLPLEWEKLFHNSQEKHEFFRSLAVEISSALPILRQRALPNLRERLPIKSFPDEGCFIALRFQPLPGRRLIVKLVIESDLKVEMMRVERLVDKLPSKLRKLSKWKEAGAETALVLENPDIQITSEGLAISAVQSVVEASGLGPDYVFWVDTTINENPAAIAAKVHGDWSCWPVGPDGIVQYFPLDKVDL